jgi:MFS family permease
MITPPRTAELLLQSLGAEASFREPLLGDLAEEFALRVERDGTGAARRWYYGESIRVAPYLLRAWGRGLHARDLRRLASIVFAAFFFTMMLAFLVVMMGQSVDAAFGFTRVLPLGDGYRVQLLRAFALTEGVVYTVAGGYIAAWLDDRAPLASAVALGVTWSCIGIAGTAISGGHGVPGWYRVCAPIILLVGPALGGILRVRALRTVGAPHLLLSASGAS